MTRRAYTPRAFAPLAMQHFREVPRCALFAKPGMGKTTMVATHLDIAHNLWGDDHQTLVLGPKRVAQHVWTDEVQKWEHLRGLEVVSLAGLDQDARRNALKRDAQVKVINYDLLPWLLAHARPWPFRRLVLDESTRVKNFRLRQGGVRARALGQVAHKLVREVIELTGTPSPNGLIDLWGQMWFLDEGVRLGRTFSSFQERYFSWRSAAQAHAKDKSRLVQTPVEHAQDLIHEKLADICLTLDPRDYFDMREPIVNVVEVALPPAAQAKYRELEKELFFRLETGEDVEVFNAAALTIKCLQLANGAVYLEDGVTWRSVHDEKLDALESIVEELSGAPLLCAYHFKSDLARLKQRFPDALVLADDGDMARAKAGEGRLWLGHPAGMGHGVDGLQEHCCDVAFFGHWWDLEQHDQMVERVGPMRQLQAGKDRAVTVHYIVARRTVDQLVMARRHSKRKVQDLLLDYMKGNT
jgi:hypothetical protein